MGLSVEQISRGIDLSVDEINRASDMISKDELKRLSQDEEAQMVYEAREKAQRDDNARYRFSFNKGKNEGIIKGDRNGRLYVAKNLLGIELPIEQIVSLTNLSIEDINELREI
ncbi:MAG: hypothetical protein FWG51_04635, partial [Firmicutes bacterium]|nr:hypothetical protein [Bacillota bacterium]